MSIGVAYRVHREVPVAPFVADLDPRVSPPPDSALFVLNETLTNVGNPLKAVHGHSLYVAFLDAGGALVVGPTCDFQTWVRDDGVPESGWVGLRPVTGLISGRSLAHRAVGRLWVQVLGVGTVGAAVKMEVRIAERGWI